MKTWLSSTTTTFHRGIGNILCQWLHVPLCMNVTNKRQTPVSHSILLCSTEISSVLIWVSFRTKEKPKLFKNRLVICPVDDFFILSTHILQSRFVNTANEHNYHLPFHFHQEAGILGLHNLVYVLIFFLEFNTLPSNNREPDFSNLSNCRVINERIMHSNLKGTQVDVWMFMYPSTLESDDTALRLFFI